MTSLLLTGMIYETVELGTAAVAVSAVGAVIRVLKSY